jgi:hypothetical protein
MWKSVLVDQPKQLCIHYINKVEYTLLQVIHTLLPINYNDKCGVKTTITVNKIRQSHTITPKFT